MKRIYQSLSPFRIWWPICGFCFLGCLFMAGCDVAQTSGAPSENSSQNTLEISIQALCEGKILSDGATVPAPAEIYIMPHVETSVAMRAGDTVNIDFYADTNKLCSTKAVWRDAIKPSNRPNQFSPMIMAPAEFGYSFCAWTNGTAGAHTLTARASGLHGLSAISAPVQITIVPPPAP